MRPTRRFVLNLFSSFATLAFIGHEMCDAHHFIASTTAASDDSICFAASMVCDTPGSDGESNTIVDTTSGFNIFSTAAAVAPLPHANTDTFFNDKSRRTVSMSSATAKEDTRCSLPVGIGESIEPRNATPTMVMLRTSEPIVSGARSTICRAEAP